MFPAPQKVFDWKTPLPLFRRFRQEFLRPQVVDVPAEVKAALDTLNIDTPLKGKRIAITAGSRGITAIPSLLKSVSGWLRDHGASPFIIPAMGSHGGGTAEGQRQVLANLGITEESVGIPIHSSMDVVEVGRLANGMPVYVDRIAATADGIVILNRVKPHTDYVGDFESGLAKMTSIGMGKLVGASTIHSYGVEGLRDLMPAAARLICEKLPVLFGLASIENAYHEMAQITAVPPSGIAGPQELELAQQAYRLMPYFPFDEIDLLIVEQMGKNISGVGMDPKVIGRVKVHKVHDLADCSIRTIVVLGLTHETHGNASGIGLADITTRRLVEEIDFEQTYLNCITSGITGIQRALLPLIAPDDRAAVMTGLRVCGRADLSSARIVRIKNTLSLSELDLSEGLWEQADQESALTPISSSFGLQFDRHNRMHNFEAERQHPNL